MPDVGLQGPQPKCPDAGMCSLRYFKRFTVPEMDHLHLALEQPALSWRHNHNTLVISYQKPEAFKELVSDLLFSALLCCTALLCCSCA